MYAIRSYYDLDSEIILFSVVNVGYVSPPGLLGIIKSKKEKESIKKRNNFV